LAWSPNLTAPTSLIVAVHETMVVMTGPTTDTDAPVPRRVLIAEDEALIRLDLAEMLREEGYEVVGEAGDGQEAVELAEQHKPDLVIMDVKMPRRDGIDAASEIASKRIAPIVVLTAFSQRDLVERARDAGAMAYLVKPFTISDLIPAIELAVSRFSEIRVLEHEVETLSERLETRKVVERAKGLLQEKQGMTEPEAFKWIQRAAMDRRTTMKRVAEVVLETLGDSKDAGDEG
jgi:response regulator NasT